MTKARAFFLFLFAIFLGGVMVFLSIEPSTRNTKDAFSPVVRSEGGKGREANSAASPTPAAAEIASLQAGRQESTKWLTTNWPRAKLLDTSEKLLPTGEVQRLVVIQPAGLPYPVRIAETVDATETGKPRIRRELWVANRFVVALSPETSAAELSRIQVATGAEKIEVLSDRGLYQVLLSQSGVDAVSSAMAKLEAAKLPVLYVEPDRMVHAEATPNDPSYGVSWGLNNTGQTGGTAGADISAPTGWDVLTNSGNMIVAVIDSGVRYTHEDMTANMWTNPVEIPNNSLDDDHNGYIDDVYGINALFGNGDPMDDAANGHGTHCAGIIGAVGNNGKAIAGVAWSAKIMALKFLGVEGYGSSSDAIKCIDYARIKGAKVINLAWGGSGTQALFDCIKRASDAGIILVIAAGNDGLAMQSGLAYPASYSIANLVSVAATDDTDTLASFSNFSNNGSVSPHLAAPGVGILSLDSSSDTATSTRNGTSMAASYASGVFALTRAQFPTDSGADIIYRVLRSVDIVPGLASQVSTSGRLNLSAALTSVNTPDIDNFGNATVLTGNATITSQNRHATSEVSNLLDNVANGNAVWYSWTAPSSGPTSVSLASSLFDTRLGVYTGAAIGALTSVVTNDNFNNTLQSKVTFDAVAGTTYQIAVAGKSGATGIFSLAITRPVILNDDFDAATAFTGNLTLASPLALTGNNTTATSEAGDPRQSSAKPSVWWKWTCAADGLYQVDTAGSSFDTTLGVYTGASVNATTEVGYHDNVSSVVKTSLVRWLGTAGVDYYFRVSGSLNATGTVTLNLSVVPTVSISGMVTSAPGVGLGNVTITTGTRSTTSNSSTGNYLIDFLTDGNYTLTPTRIGYSFLPATQTANITVATGNYTTANFTQAYTIAGKVTYNGVGLAGVKISGNTTIGNATTDSAGAYLFSKVPPGSYTLNATLLDYVFSADIPVSLPTGGVMGNSSSNNFTATLPVPANDTFASANATSFNGTVSGFVSITANGTNRGSGNETGESFRMGEGKNSVWWKWDCPTSGTYQIQTTGSSFNTTLGVYTGASVNATTEIAWNDSNGSAITSLCRWDATAGTSYYFRVSGYSGATGNVTLTLTALYSISGTVALNGSGITNIVVGNSTAAMSATVNATTGNYVLTNVPAGNYTLTPSPTTYSFTPATLSANVTTANLTGQDFAASYAISGLVTLYGASLANVTISDGNRTVLTAANGTYTFPSATIGNYTLTPTLGNYTFTPVTKQVTSTPSSNNFVAVPVPPSNDSFSSATTVNGTVSSGNNVTVTGTNYGATSETNEPRSTSSRSVWWQWTPVTTGLYQVETTGSSFSTTLGIYTGASVNATTEIGYNTTNGTVTTSLLRWVATAGQAYYFRIGGATTTSGNITLGLSLVPTVSINGTITSAPGVGFGNVTVSTGSSNATTDASGNYSFSYVPVGNYTLTPARSGVAFTPSSQRANVTTANVTASADFIAPDFTVAYSMGGRVTLASGVGVAGVTVSGNGTGNATTNASGNYTITGVASGSGPYTITPSRSGYTFNATTITTGTISANLTGANFTATLIAPVNDSFGNATAVTGSVSGVTAVTVGGSTIGAGNETAEVLPVIHANDGTNSVWMTWNCTSNGTYQVETTGSSFDSTLGIYTGNSGNALTEVGWNNGTSVNSLLTWNATTGSQYHFRVAGYNGASGNFTLKLSALYSISGNVSVGGVPLAGVRVVAGTLNATTDAGGNYSILLVTPGNSTLVPYLVGYTFLPTTQVVPIGSSNVTGINFVASANNAPSNDSFANATVIAGDPFALGTLTYNATNANATVEIGEPRSTHGKSIWWTWNCTTNGTYRIATTGSSFDTILGVYTGSTVNATTEIAWSDNMPGVRTSYNTWNATTTGSPYYFRVAGSNGATGNVTLSLLPLYTINGTVDNAGVPMGNVTVSDGTRTATTNSTTGNYTIFNVPLGNYTINATKTGYSFTPTGISVTLNGHYTGANFTILGAYSISGRVVGSSASARGLLTLAATSGNTTATVSSNGSYSFPGLSNGNYTLTPSLNGYTFTPGNLTITIAGGNRTSADFAALLDNLLEYALSDTGASSTPTSASDPLLLTQNAAKPVLGVSGNRLTLTFLRARSDVIYTVQSSSDLVNWIDVSYIPVGVGESQVVTDTMDMKSNGKRFMRLNVSQP